MFEHCNGLIDKICVVFCIAIIFILIGIGSYFLGYKLNTGYLGVIAGEVIVVLLILRFEKIYKRYVISEYRNGRIRENDL